MGRPLKKDVIGTDVIGPFAAAGQTGIIVEGYFGGSLAVNYYIIKQRGAKAYVVSNDAGVTRNTGVLVATQPAANGEIRIVGYNGVTATAIAKMNKRTCRDFAGNKYTWVVTDLGDSAGDTLVLTPVA